MRPNIGRARMSKRNDFNKNALAKQIIGKHLAPVIEPAKPTSPNDAHQALLSEADSALKEAGAEIAPNPSSLQQSSPMLKEGSPHAVGSKYKSGGKEYALIGFRGPHAVLKGPDGLAKAPISALDKFSAVSSAFFSKVDFDNEVMSPSSTMNMLPEDMTPRVVKPMRTKFRARKRARQLFSSFDNELEEPDPVDFDNNPFTDSEYKAAYNKVIAKQYGHPEAKNHDWVGQAIGYTKKSELPVEDTVHAAVGNLLADPPKVDNHKDAVSHWTKSVAGAARQLSKEIQPKEKPMSSALHDSGDVYDPMAIHSHNRRLDEVTGSSLDQKTPEERIYARLQRRPNTEFRAFKTLGIDGKTARTAIQKLKDEGRIDPNFRVPDLEAAKGNTGIPVEQQITEFIAKNPKATFTKMAQVLGARADSKRSGVNTKGLKEVVNKLKSEGKIPDDFRVTRDFNFRKGGYTGRVHVSKDINIPLKDRIKETIEKSTSKMLNVQRLGQVYNKAGVDYKSYDKALKELEAEGSLPANFIRQKPRPGGIALDEVDSRVLRAIQNNPNRPFEGTVISLRGVSAQKLRETVEKLKSEGKLSKDFQFAKPILRMRRSQRAKAG